MGVATARTYHNLGVIRGLLWALRGDDPGPHLHDAASVFDLAGIPCQPQKDGKIVYAIPGDHNWPASD